MKTFVNTYALAATVHESAALGVLGTLVHPVAEPGEYAGTVLLGGRVVGRFLLDCDSDVAEQQVRIDLAACDAGLAQGRPAPTYRLAPDGYLVLYVSQGRGGYAVTLQGTRSRSRRAVFDSRVLQAGDLYAVTLIRPGAYEMGNTQSRARGIVRVTYPEAGMDLRDPGAAVSVECGGGELSPSEVTLLPAQGLVFRIAAPSAVRVSLREADDGPDAHKGRPLRRAQWIKPAAKPLRDPARS
jgi:hypothetical protein